MTSTHIRSYALGRHQEHDPRSRNHPAARATVLKSVMWTHHGAVLNQGQVGSCTGNASVDVLMTSPYWDEKEENFTEKDALDIYTQATHLDSIPGSYPSQDTGSSGIAAMKACRERHYIRAYKHAFGIEHALAALMLGPVITGTPWLQEMFNPDPDGTIHVSGAVEGGHEYCILGYDAAEKRVRGLNSWSDTWGDKGYFWMSVSDWEKLLDNGGDVCVPVI